MATSNRLIRRSSPTKKRFVEGEFEWIEKNGIENLKGRAATADMLAKEASTTLTVLLAGVGGSVAYAIKVAGDHSGAVVAGTFVCVYLMVLSALLVYRCMMINPIPAVYSQPGGLLERIKHDASFDEWREGELLNIEDRIIGATKRNEFVAKKLNLVRQLAICTPIVGLAGFLFATKS